MASYVTIFIFFTTSVLAVCTVSISGDIDIDIDRNMVQMAHTMVVQATNWAQLSAHDESSLIFGHHRHDRRHHGGGGGGGLDDEDDLGVDDSLILGRHRHRRRHHGGGTGGGIGGGGGGGGGVAYNDTTVTEGGIHDSTDDEEDDSTLNDNMILGRHRHRRRHHGGGGIGGGGGGGGGGGTPTEGGRHDSTDDEEDDSTLNDSMILGRHRHRRRHHGGGGVGGGGGGGGGDIGGSAYNDTLTEGGRQGGDDDDEDDSTLADSLIFGRHRHRRRHHGGGAPGGGGGGGGGGLADNDTVTGGRLGGDDNDEDDSTLNNTMILGRHRHRRRHHGGGGGGGGLDDESTYNNTLIFGRGKHHGGGSSGGSRGGGHRGGGGGGHGHDDNEDDSPYDNTLIFGRGKGHGSSRGSGGGGGGHHGGRSGGHHGDANPNSTYNETNNNVNNYNNYNNQRVALNDCATLYDQVEPLLTRLLDKNESYTRDDALAWLSGALTSHTTCLDGLQEKGLNDDYHPLAQNLTAVLNDALALHAKKLKSGDNRAKGAQGKPRSDQYRGLLSSWNPATSRADIVVAKDGSGNYRTIREAVNALGRIANKGGGRRVVVHVRAGVYDENVEIGRNLRNVMFVGEGMDKTVVTGRRNFIDGDSTVSSATFRVFGDGFWARDMTFENTAGPQKHQAVALMVASDNSLFYRCGVKGYQDSLYAHSLRQFYRDCKIYGTVDFIFGNAAVVLQNCDILVRRPMNGQANMITAQGRDNPNENTGISIHGSRIRPAPEYVPIKGSTKTFLGRPWKRYSRTVVVKTEIDGMIHPRGWTEWSGKFALSTLYYGEYMNTGPGASTRGRVNWPGYHVLRSPREVGPFTVRNFIQGESWIMRTGVPVWTEI